jgi:WD40 repeat protein
MIRKSPDDATLQPDRNHLAATLAAYDEYLRSGAIPCSSDPTRIAGATDAEATELMGCLNLLELVWPRAAVANNVNLPKKIGRFQLERVLGVGGFGIVYKAHDPLLHRDVALKVPRLHSLSDAKLRERFQKEAYAAASLDHPNIVPIYETGDADSIGYIASAYCSGPNLAEWLTSQKTPVPLRLAAVLIETLAQAVHYSHSRGVLHRDLKPSNVMLVPDGMVPTDSPLDLPFVPRLTDFGVAKFLNDDSAAAKPETLELGTPIYMAPELTGKLGLSIGPATDVYGLGVILYELMTGRPPFGGANIADLFQQIRTSEPVAPRRLRREIPIDLETICLRCLEKKPANRFSTAKDLADDLNRYLRSEPIKSRPVGYIGQLQRWCWRRPALAGLVGVTMTAIVAILALLVAFVGLLTARNQDLTAHNDQVTELNADLTHAANRARVSQAAAEESEKQAKDLLYVADINRAGIALKNEDTRALLECLERQVPKPGEFDRRGFEWWYLRQRSRRIERVLFDVGTPLYFVCESPDRSQMATAGKDAIVRLFDPLNGTISLQIPTGQIEVNGLAFSPDGKELATSGDDGTIRLWNLATGHERLNFKAHPGKAYQLLFTPDGREIISCGDDPVIRVFDAASGELRQRLTGHRREVQSLVMGVSGKKFASAGFDGIAIVWELTEIGPYKHSLFFEKGIPFGPIALREDRDFVIVGADFSDLFTIRLSKNVTGEAVKTPESAVNDLENAEALALHPDGNVLAAGNKSGRIRLWNVGPQGEISPGSFSPWQAHRGNVASLSWSSDGARLISVGDDGRVMSWSPTGNHADNPRRIENDNLTEGFCLIPQTDRFLITEDTGSKKGTVIFDWRTASEVSRMDGVEFTEATASFDGRFLAVNILRRVDDEVHDELKLFEVQETNNRPLVLQPVANWNSTGKLGSLCFSPDSTQLALSYWRRPKPQEPEEHFVRLFGLPDLRLIETIPVRNAKAIDFSPDRKYAALATNIGLTLWDLRQRYVAWDVSQRDLSYLIFSPDGSLVVTGGDDRLVVVRNTSDGSIRFRLAGHRARLRALAFSPDGRTLATGDHEGSLKFWNIRVGQEALEIDHPRFAIQVLRFTPDGRHLLFKGFRVNEHTRSNNSVLVFDAPNDEVAQ